jgi:hypothetical protein
VSPETGDWTVNVVVTLYDEFNIPVPATGSMDLTINATDRTIHAVLNNGQTEYSIEDLPYHKYLVTIRKDGYYLSQQVNPSDLSIRLMKYSLQMFAIPGPKAKIDSIHCELGTVIPRLFIQLHSPQVLPAGGWRGAVIFAGLTPGVNTRYGTYVATIGVSQTAGTAIFQTADVYDALRAAGIAPGVKVYLTARVTTNAAIATRDEATGLSVYSNIEENSTAVTSFIMP